MVWVAKICLKSVPSEDVCIMKTYILILCNIFLDIFVYKKYYTKFTKQKKKDNTHMHLGTGLSVKKIESKTLLWSSVHT